MGEVAQKHGIVSRGHDPALALAAHELRLGADLPDLDASKFAMYEMGSDAETYALGFHLYFDDGPIDGDDTQALWGTATATEFVFGEKGGGIPTGWADTGDFIDARTVLTYQDSLSMFFRIQGFRSWDVSLLAP